MPTIIPTLAEITRKKNRNCLMVCFHKYNEGIFNQSKLSEGQLRTYKVVHQFLIDNNFSFYPAYPSLDKGVKQAPYLNSLYIDTEMNEDNPKYKMLCDFLEDKNGKPKHKHLEFIYITPKLAEKFK